MKNNYFRFLTEFENNALFTKEDFTEAPNLVYPQHVAMFSFRTFFYSYLMNLSLNISLACAAVSFIFFAIDIKSIFGHPVSDLAGGLITFAAIIAFAIISIFSDKFLMNDYKKLLKVFEHNLIHNQIGKMTVLKPNMYSDQKYIEETYDLKINS